MIDAILELRFGHLQPRWRSTWAWPTVASPPLRPSPTPATSPSSTACRASPAAPLPSILVTQQSSELCGLATSRSSRTPASTAPNCSTTLPAGVRDVLWATSAATASSTSSHRGQQRAPTSRSSPTSSWSGPNRDVHRRPDAQHPRRHPVHRVAPGRRRRQARHSHPAGRQLDPPYSPSVDIYFNSTSTFAHGPRRHRPTPSAAIFAFLFDLNGDNKVDAYYNRRHPRHGAAARSPTMKHRFYERWRAHVPDRARSPLRPQHGLGNFPRTSTATASLTRGVQGVPDHPTRRSPTPSSSTSICSPRSVSRRCSSSRAAVSTFWEFTQSTGPQARA